MVGLSESQRWDSRRLLVLTPPCLWNVLSFVYWSIDIPMRIWYNEYGGGGMAKRDFGGPRKAVCVYLSEQLHARLEFRVAEQDASLSALVRRYVTEGLDRAEDLPRAEKKEREQHGPPA